tara:strand:+ start:446 stop:733 length:288 start_codon:yes stop_codon:yes gene_type:complete
LNKNNSKKAPNNPQIIKDKIIEIGKLIPNGENLSRYRYLESTGLEKNNVQIAPSAIISPCAKLTILVTPYNSDKATEAIAIIIPNKSPFPNWSNN